MEETSAKINPNEIRIRLIMNREDAVGICEEIEECNSNVDYIQEIYYSQNCVDEERTQLINKASMLNSRIRSLKMRLLEISKAEINDYAILQNIANKKKNLAANLSGLPQFGNATIDFALSVETQSIAEYQMLMDEIQSFLSEIDKYLSDANPVDATKSYGQKTL